MCVDAHRTRGQALHFLHRHPPSLARHCNDAQWQDGVGLQSWEEGRPPESEEGGRHHDGSVSKRTTDTQ
jgi:hypothetical protein